MDDLDEGDQVLFRVRPRRQIGDGPLLDPFGRFGVARHHLDQTLGAGPARGGRVAGLVAGGDVDARHEGEPAEQRLPRTVPSFGHEHLGDLADGLLPVAEHETVDEVGERLGVERAVTSGDHDRMAGTPFDSTHRHPSEVDEVEDVGVDELGGEVEGQDVEGGRGQLVLEREEGDPRRAHGGLHVDPGRIGPFGHRVVTFVQDLVEDLETLVGKADLVGVRVDEEPGDLPRPVLAGLCAVLAADVAGRLCDLGQQRLDLWPE